MRLPNWIEQLAEVLRDAERKPFAWGSHDCCQFAARCVQAVTGEDMLRNFARYTCESEALGIIWALGGMRGLVTFALGNEKPVAFATHGDIVLIDFGLGPQPAVCMGRDSFSPGPSGIHCQPTHMAIAAWAV